MYAQVEKSKENKSRAVANNVAQKKSNGKQGFGFVDNRIETVAQRNVIQRMPNDYELLKTYEGKKLQVLYKDGPKWIKLEGIVNNVKATSINVGQKRFTKNWLNDYDFRINIPHVNNNYETDSDSDSDDEEHVGVELREKKEGGTGEFDGIRVGRKKFYEDKQADLKGAINTLKEKSKTNSRIKVPKEIDLAKGWSKKQIVEKTKRRIEALEKADATGAPKDSGRPVPSIDTIRGFKHLKFRMEDNSGALREAVTEAITELMKLYPNWTFTTKFGALPAKLNPEDDPKSKFFVE